MPSGLHILIDSVVKDMTESECDALVFGIRSWAAEEVAAERERWEKPATMAVQELAHCAEWTSAGVACKALRDALTPNVELSGGR